MKTTVIFILGPTSSGKTAVSSSLAKKIKGEIISCDSMQVYKGMDILTQAPSKELSAEIAHFLVREISPEEEFNAAKFSEKAKACIESILAREKIPIFAGGTGLYVKALVDGLFPAPPGDTVIRMELEKAASDNGNDLLYEELKKIDPVTAGKLHVNDTRRIIRALEVFEMTGKLPSEKKNETSGISKEYNCLMFGLDLPREKLYSRINENVEKMVKSGLIDEVKALMDKDLSRTAGKALGLKEIGAFLRGEKTIDETKEGLKRNTRRYAKRQLTWFRGDDRIRWINADRDINGIVEEIYGIVRGKIKK